MTSATQLGSRSAGSRAVSLAGGVPGRLTLALLAVAVAAHYSLATLAGAWRYQTPLADLILVPVIAAGLFAAAAMRHPAVGGTRLRRLDVPIATLSLAAAAALMVLAPVVLANYYWAVRLDLLVLPLVAAAAVALLFGTRTIVAFAFPLSFLLLAWPLPHQMLLEQVITGVTGATSTAVKAFVSVTGIAEIVPSSGGLRLLVPFNGDGFQLSVASACAGTESLVGFGLVGTAAMYLVSGPLKRRLAWLAVGAAAVWLGNLARIAGLLVAGRLLGPTVAIDVLHPVAGIAVLNAVFVLMAALLPRFGLRRRPFGLEAAADSPLTRPEEPAPGRSRLPLRLVGLALAAALLALANANLAGAANTYSNAGHPVSASFQDQPQAGPRWRVGQLERFDWSRAYFGTDSSWVRYRLTPAKGALAMPFTIWADSIDTSSYAALVAHPVRDCYRWHHFDVLKHERIQLGSGIIGERLVYERPGGAGRWHVVTWEWPVSSGGDRLRHERMVLLASTSRTAPEPEQDLGGGSMTGAVLAALNASASGSDPNPGLSQAMLAAARGMIAARVSGGLR